MTLFVTVVTRDLTYVLLCFVVIDLRLVNSGSRGGILLGFVLLLLLVLPGLIRRPGILGRSGYESLSLGFVPAMIFHHSLGLDLVCGGMGWSIPSKDLQVDLSYIKTWS